MRSDHESTDLVPVYGVRDCAGLHADGQAGRAQYLCRVPQARRAATVSEPADPYEIIITGQDVPQRLPEGIRHSQEMAYVRISIPAAHMRRIDRAAASINVGRPDVIRAIIRQALEQPAEVVTAWGRSGRL